MNWIDLATLVVLAFAAFNGWRRGFITELTGFLALAAALVAGFSYTGEFDGLAGALLHLGGGSAHVAGLLGFSAIAYLAIWTLGFFANRVARLPLLNLINGALGGALGVVKTLLILLVVDYLATFAPLPGDFRADLDHSVLGRTFGGVDAGFDGDLANRMPFYLQPFWNAIRHQQPS